MLASRSRVFQRQVVLRQEEDLGKEDESLEAQVATVEVARKRTKPAVARDVALTAEALLFPISSICRAPGMGFGLWGPRHAESVRHDGERRSQFTICELDPAHRQRGDREAKE